MATVPLEKLACPLYSALGRPTVTSRLRVTTLHGVPWSAYVNSPLDALAYCSVVVHSLGPRGFLLLKFGKLSRPSGNVSTYIRQSVISIVSNTTRRLKSVDQG